MAPTQQGQQADEGDADPHLELPQQPGGQYEIGQQPHPERDGERRLLGPALGSGAQPRQRPRAEGETGAEDGRPDQQ